MTIFDQVIDDYNTIMETPLQNKIEKKFSYDLVLSQMIPESKTLQADLSDCSDTEPIRYINQLKNAN